MKSLIRRLALSVVLAAGLWPQAGWAQQQYDAGGKSKVSLYGKNAINGDTPLAVDGSGNLSISASISGFTPNGSVANLPVTDASANVALPTGTVVVVTNSGSNDAHIKLSVGAGTAATTDMTVKAGAAVGLAVGSNTYINGIAATGLTTNLNIVGGAGFPTGYGVGGSGSGGAVTIADGADVALGTTTDSSCGTDTGTCTLEALVKRLNASITTLNTTASGSIPAGTNHIGEVAPTTSNLTKGTITSAMTGTTSTLLLAAPAAGTYNYITQITCWNSHASVDTGVDLQDGSGGTVFYSIPAAHSYGGSAISFSAPLKQPTAATGLYVVDETTGASVKCSASGFTK